MTVKSGLATPLADHGIHKIASPTAVDPSETAATARARVEQAQPPADPDVLTIGRRTAQGAVVTTIATAAAFVLRTGSMITLARLVVPRDFGLVGMVTAFTGFLALLRDGGLSMAAIQRSSVTDDQTSTLFWINLAVGAALAGLCAAAGPVLARFYGEPRLPAIALFIGLGFLFNSAGIQHRALLQRAMRFRILAAIDTASLMLSIVIVIAMAAAGAGYWAVAMMTVALPALSTAFAWGITRWVPGAPRRRTGVRAMLWYGGSVTLNNIIVYIAYNTDKVLLGRFWGAEALGIYGRAYQLINIPNENLNSCVGLVAFPALSRMQHDPARLRQYFLKGYGFFQCLILPIACSCLLFADDIVRVFLGPKWSAAAGIFRLLAPTVVAFALVNPLAWFMFAAGRTRISLKISSLIVPIVVGAYSLGLRAGPQGVAFGFSAAMTLLVVPITWLAIRDTAIALRDIVQVVMHPMMSIIAAAAVVMVLGGWTHQVEPALLRLAVDSSMLFGIYAFVLLWVLDQKSEYAATLRQAGLWPVGWGLKG